VTCGSLSGDALPAGDFAVWLRATRAALEEKRAADPPCGGCNACCRTSHYIHVRPEDGRALRKLPRAFLFPAPDLPPGNLVLGYDEAGRCPMLVEGRCTIYDVRPRACRTYDCRIYAAAGIPADRPEIDVQARRWVFAYPTTQDREGLDAVRSAVRFIRGHPECLPSDAARGQPLRVAVLAIAVSERFLPRRGFAARWRSDERRTVRAVGDANEKYFGDG
jgi:hypothetical protein